jgi:diadenosine tetraphosphate (Ap4A) HIT family hydrolase
MPADPSSAGWTLDPRLERDTIAAGDLPLCRLLIINDANYPWLVLVPRRQHIVEIVDLGEIERAKLMGEIADTSRALKAISGCDKINVAALGNVVAQLHVHVIARTRGDAAWPRPVWGVVPPRAYEPAPVAALIGALLRRLPLSTSTPQG